MNRATERVAPWVTAALLLVLWWLIVVAFGIESFVLPSPIESVAALYQYRYPLAVHGLATLTTTSGSLSALFAWPMRRFIPS